MIIKGLVLCVFGTIGFIDGLLLFASATACPNWFNPFVGLLILVVLPFAGAITILFREKIVDREKNEFR